MSDSTNKINPLRDAFRRAVAESKILEDALRVEASRMPQLPDPASWLNESERHANKLADDFPEKNYILRCIQFARRDLAEGNNTELQTWIVQINRKLKSAWSNKYENERIKSKKGGSIGGSREKKKEWAEIIANELAQSGYTKQEDAWNAVPESIGRWERETDKADYEIYRDGTKIFAVYANTSQSLKKSSFLKYYYSPAKKNLSNNNL